MNLIRSDMLASDVIVLVSPVYNNSISGSTKVFLDRISCWTHLFKLAGKYAILVTVSDRKNMNGAMEYLKYISDFLGLYVVDSVVVEKENLIKDEFASICKKSVNKLIRVLTADDELIHVSERQEQCFRSIDITDSIGVVYAFCRYLLRDCDFSAADTKTQMLLISTQKCQFQQRFENSLLPQLIELYQTNPEQIELALGDQAIHLERVLQGWQQGQECYKLNDYQPDLQLDGPAVAYREDALYANLRRVYEENPTAKYFGSFGAAHVQMENYVQKEGSSRINNSFVSRMAGKNSFLDGRLTVIDGAITHEIGELGEADTNHLTLYNTALAKNPGSESGKFYAEAPDTPDEKIAQYVLLFEHPSQVTASEDQPGRYWKNYKEK